MLKISITDPTVETSTINGKNGSFQARRQRGMVKLPNGETRLVRIRLSEGKQYQPGDYIIGDGSFMVGLYGDLQLGTLELIAAPKNG